MPRPSERRRPSRSARTILLASSLLLSGISCVDGPFARLNPNDAEFPGTMTLYASRDTISPANPVVVFKVVTDPVVNGYQPLWFVASGTGILDRGNGVYELGSIPSSIAPVTIRAVFQGRSVERTIFRSPTP